MHPIHCDNDAHKIHSSHVFENFFTKILNVKKLEHFLWHKKYIQVPSITLCYLTPSCLSVLLTFYSYVVRIVFLGNFPGERYRTLIRRGSCIFSCGFMLNDLLIGEKHDVIHAGKLGTESRRTAGCHQRALGWAPTMLSKEEKKCFTVHRAGHSHALQTVLVLTGWLSSGSLSLSADAVTNITPLSPN